MRGYIGAELQCYKPLASREKAGGGLREKNAIAVMMKAPLLGQVKTRMAPLSEDAILKFYICCVEDTLSKVSNLGQIAFFIYPSIDTAESLLSRFSKDVLILSQEGATFNTRLQHSLRYLFGLGMDKVLQIGTDSPHLEKATLEEAFLLLDHTDLVIGPAWDGGFYLLGMKKPYLALYEDLPLSQSCTLALLVKRAKSMGLRIQNLPLLRDIDTLSDLVALKKSGNLGNCPKVVEFLQNNFKFFF